MADTVKKSRIVSDNDDNLEEALMEEFNMRLKSCMSKDNLQDSDEEKAEADGQDQENSIYENVEAIRITNQKQNLSPSKTSSPSADFIQIERDSYDEEPLEVKNGLENSNHGHHVPSTEDLGNNIYDDVTQEVKTDPSSQNHYVEMHSVEMKQQPPPDVVQVEYEDMESKTAVVDKDDSKNVYENVEPFKNEDDNPSVAVAVNLEKPPSLVLPTDWLPDPDTKKQDGEEQEDEPAVKSVKDRMFLSTDGASCLLFTQTVTSPMLTPSEENIDFLKGFRRESNQNTSPDVTVSNESPKSEQVDQTDPDEKLLSNDSPKNEQVGDIDVDDKLASDQDIDDVLTEEPLDISNDEIITDLDEIESVIRDITFEGPNEPIYENIVTKETVAPTRRDFCISGCYEQIYENPKVWEGEPPNVYHSTEFTYRTEYPKKEITVENLDMTDDEKMERIYENIVESKEDAILKVCAELMEKLDDKVPEQIFEETRESEDKVPNGQSVEMVDVSKEYETNRDAGDSSDSDDVIIRPERKPQHVESKVAKIAGAIFKSVEKDDYDDTGEPRNREKDTETVPPQIVQNLKSQFLKSSSVESVGTPKKEIEPVSELKTINILKQITKFEHKENEEDSTMQVHESYVETTTFEQVSGDQEKALKKKKSKKSRKEEKENISVKSSFNKFDALQKKNLLHVRSTDSTKAQEKFNGTVAVDNSNCKSCGKVVFQMELIKAEKAVWHKNCFRCRECSKQLNVDTYQSHEGTLYCKPHFKALFTPKAVEDEEPPKPRKHELIIRENQPVELPPDVVRASDKPDLGLEELQSLNVKERFQVFEHHQTETNEMERTHAAVNVKKSPSILSKLAKFQAKGMDIGVADDSLNGIPIEESSEEEEEIPEGEDPDLVRARRVQKEKPFHFTGMSDVKSKWEHGEQNAKDERREERKQEIQSIRNRLFMGKQGKMKEAYQQAVMESETSANKKKQTETIEAIETKTLKERFEKGQILNEHEEQKNKADEEEVYESEISKKSRSLFLELDAHASKPPQMSPVTPPKLDVRKAREVYLQKSASQDVIKSSEIVEDVEVRTADIQQRFKFFETYKEPEKERKQFRITPPREGQVKEPSPEREVYYDPNVVRSDEVIEDSVIAKETHTATKMLNKFRQMEENLAKEPVPQGPKPLKRFTPPPEPVRPESSSEGESGSEDESEGIEDTVDHSKLKDEDLIEAQKAARAKQLRAKFEKWEANEIKKEQQNNTSILAEELGEEQSQIESTRVLRARFESMKETTTGSRGPRVKVNRFVKIPSVDETCKRCQYKVYPLEKISIHGDVYHKNCFKCMECSTVLRMDSYSYNQGLLYCMPHFKRLFISKGNYDSAFGFEQHKEKWNATVA